ncbi:MAG: transcription termination/antitermination protein NusG [Cytophagales bacterium]|nr:transcription termination/antitermination protein NusG [Bernardetiaceae bacterium]MDW8210417.1 transcription termination/antitermination protein NusG [Cytophagales bacterium]
MSESKLEWYILRVASGQEKKVKSYLEKEIAIHGLEQCITRVLVPSEKVYQIRKTKDGKSKKVAVEKNFFPGYVFIQADLSYKEESQDKKVNHKVIHIIKSTPGVINFLDVEGSGPNAKPLPVRESDIARILGKMDEVDSGEIRHDITFRVGETVKVMDGPFNGFTGTVEEVFEDKKKLNVMVKIFGRNAPVELNYMQVSKEL